MSYCIINKKPIYLSAQHIKELDNEVTEGKDPRWVISSTIQGHKESNEKSEMIYKFLYEKFKLDPEGFLEDWSKFNLNGEDASLNVWDLLYDYCVYYGNSIIQEHRVFQEKLLSDYEGESLSYPMGKVFTLNCKIGKSIWPLRFKYNFSKRFIQIVIDTSKVHRLVGSLSNFEIYTKGFKLRCNENIEIQ